MKTIKIGNTKVKVKVVKTKSDQETGLMHIEHLPEDEGMLFEYPKEQRLSFWMKNTKIPLSIAFINSQGIIDEMRDMEPFSLDSVRSANPAMWALEVNRGWFDKHGVEVGDKINLASKQVRIKITFDR